MGKIVTRTISLRCRCGKSDSVTLSYPDNNDAYLRELARVQAEQRIKHGCSAQ